MDLTSPELDINCFGELKLTVRFLVQGWFGMLPRLSVSDQWETATKRDEHPEVATIGHHVFYAYTFWHGTFVLYPSCHTYGTLGGMRSSVLECRRKVVHALAPQ
jgi:hypothetical protein